MPHFLLWLFGPKFLNLLIFLPAMPDFGIPGNFVINHDFYSSFQPMFLFVICLGIFLGLYSYPSPLLQALYYFLQDSSIYKSFLYLKLSMALFDLLNRFKILIWTLFPIFRYW